MYKPLGLCLNDFDLSHNPDTGLYELIHIQGPPVTNDLYHAAMVETTYGFATSPDLVNWTAQPTAFGISEDDDAFDNSAIWTMHTIRTPDGRRMMFYTGLPKVPYRVQKIGLAVYDEPSKSWKRYRKEPLLEADPRYYITEGRMSWRDPYVVRDEKNNRYIMFICAQERDMPYDRNGCVAMAVSQNLIDWEVREPILAPRKYNEMECPIHYYRNGYHYLMTSISKEPRAVYVWRSRELTGPYEEIGPLMPPYNYTPRIVEYQGKDILLHTRWVEKLNPVTGEKHWSRGYLDDPKLVEQDSEGKLSIVPFNPEG